MRVFLYAKSGHALELNRVRRCASISNELKKRGIDSMLCTSDFRAGAYAKDNLGIDRYTNVDVLKNVKNLMDRGDILIYDTDESSEIIDSDIEEFTSLAFKVGEDISCSIIDYDLYSSKDEKYETLLFYGDSDYNESFLKAVESSEKFDMPLLMGHYFFLGNEKRFKPFFSSIIDEEEYVDCIKGAKYLLTASPSAALESLSCGNSPVLFLREDFSYENLEVIKDLGIKVIENGTLTEIVKEFNSIIKTYDLKEELNRVNLENIISQIEEKLAINKMVSNN